MESIASSASISASSSPLSLFSSKRSFSRRPRSLLPITSSKKPRRPHPLRLRLASASSEFCWLTPEDFVRFFLNSIVLFSPAPALSVLALGAVRPASLAMRHYDPALSAVPLLRAAIAEQTSVAVVADDGRRLIGEISPSTLAHCTDESAVAALSAGDLMSFLDFFGAPPESTLRAIKSRLADSGLLGMLDLLDPNLPPPFSSSSSSSSIFLKFNMHIDKQNACTTITL